MNAQYICPVVTAFDEDGTIDMNAMKQLYDHLIDGGLDGIAVMGSSGEFYSMGMDEAKQFASASIAYLKGKIPVYIGTGRLIPEETVELSNHAIDCGAHAVMIVGPYYIGTDSAGVEAYYDLIAGQIKGNIILYNYPDRTGHDILPEIVLSLLKKHKNIIGFKDTVGAPSHTSQLILKVKPEYPDFKIYSGFDENFAHVVMSGGDGCIAALSNLRPKLCADWANAFRNGDLVRASEIQKTINRLMGFYSICTPFMPAMKYALRQIGIPIRPECRMPVLQPNAEQRGEIEELVRS